MTGQLRTEFTGTVATATFDRPAAGIPAGVTVTSAEEARAAVGHGAVFLVVQGPKAGGCLGMVGT